MKTKTIDVYSFEDLDESAKENAREWFRTGALGYDWWEFIFEDVKTIGKILGIEIDEIEFSGFYNQGSGACFTGDYNYAKDSRRKIREYAPQDADLHNLVDSLFESQHRGFYSISAAIRKSRWNSSHERSVSISVYARNDHASDELSDSISELMRDFMHWIYKKLRNEYEFLMSDEVVDETIIANEYEFDETGSIL
jgi:hypothetical protein